MKPLIATVFAVLAFAGTALAGPVDDAMTRERLEAMLERGDDILVEQTFKRHLGQATAFIDGYLEGGLKMIEEGADESHALHSYKLAIQFARLASSATEDRTILEYAASFASWSPQEQATFREGQKAHGAGRAAEKAGDDDQAALEHYHRSYRLARSLGDTWGEGMAAAGLSRMALKLGRAVEGIRYGRDSIVAYRGLRMAAAEARVLLGLAAELESRESRRGGLSDLSRAWHLVRSSAADDELRKEVAAAYIAALDKRSLTEQIAELQTDIDRAD